MPDTPKKDARKPTPQRATPGFHGKPGRSGPAKENHNAMRHGLKAGKLPKDAKYIETRLNLFRRNLEDALIAAYGKIDIPSAAYIQTAIRWERHAALAQRWLTETVRHIEARAALILLQGNRPR